MYVGTKGTTGVKESVFIREVSSFKEKIVFVNLGPYKCILIKEVWPPFERCVYEEFHCTLKLLLIAATT